MGGVEGRCGWEVWMGGVDGRCGWEGSGDLAREAIQNTPRSMPPWTMPSSHAHAYVTATCPSQAVSRWHLHNEFGDPSAKKKNEKTTENLKSSGDGGSDHRLSSWQFNSPSSLESSK